MSRTPQLCIIVTAFCSLLSGITREQYRTWNTPVKPFRIIGRMYYRRRFRPHSFLITSSQGHILLDGGLPETAIQIERNVAALGFRMKDVKMLLNSHAHFDHAARISGTKNTRPAHVGSASRQDAPALISGTRTISPGLALSTSPPFSVDQVVKK